ncbi:MAG: hypothetical protein R3E83_13610 [Burkholderiaceae bacterium]
MKSVNRVWRWSAIALLGMTPVTGQAQSDVYMRGWQPGAAAMQCIDLSKPRVNGIPSVDPVNGSCMDDALRRRFEDEFARIAGWMRDGRLHNPDFLRPVVPLANQPTLLLYVNPARNDYAAYASPCSNGVRTNGVRGVIEFNNDPNRLSQPGVPSAVLTHELAHAVQFGSGFALTDPRFCSGTALTPVLNWVREGMADALAWEYVRTFLPNEWKVLINRGSKLWKRAAGLRPYDFPLPFREAASTEESNYLFSKQQNYVSAYWRHLAWRYHGGDIFFVRGFFDETIPSPPDWTRWANGILKKNRATRHGFYTTYPTFIADWASMNTSKAFKAAAIPDATWRKAMFTGCPTIEVPKGGANAIAFDLKQLSAKCIRLRIKDLNDGEIGTIRIFGKATGSASVEELHLSEIERVSADTRRCSEILDGILGQGQKPIPGVDCVVSRTIPSGMPGLATFDPSPLYGSAGNDDIVMAISRVGLDPGDADSLANVKPEGFRLDFSVDTSVVSLGAAGAQPAQPSLINSRIWTNTHLPYDIDHPTLAAQEGKIRGPAAAAFGGGGMPVVTMEQFTGINPAGDGAWSIGFDTYDVRVEQSPYGESRGFEPKGSFALHLKKPQELVAGQSYETFATYSEKAPKSFLKMLAGGGASPPRGRNDFEPTIMTVVEHTEQRLTLSFNGRICMGANLARATRNGSAADCLSLEPLSGTVSVAYPRLYTMNGLLTYDQASEGNRIYRQQLVSQFNRTMMLAFGSRRPRTGDAGAAARTTGKGHSANGGSAAATQACDCSCEAYEALQNAGKSGNPGPLGGMLRCVMKCARQYSACKN